MSLASQVTALAARVRDEFNALRNSEMPCEVLLFSFQGAVSTGVGTSRVPIHGGTFDIVGVYAMVNTAPTGASLIVDVNKNGTTIYGTQSNRPTIAASTNGDAGGTQSVTSVTTGDYLTVDRDQIGSTVAGSDLVVSVRLRRTA